MMKGEGAFQNTDTNFPVIEQLESNLYIAFIRIDYLR